MTDEMLDEAHLHVIAHHQRVLANARKTDAGSRNVKLVARPGSTNYSSSAQALTTSYLYYGNTWETNPDTSSAWTISEVNASQFGVEVG